MVSTARAMTTSAALLGCAIVLGCNLREDEFTVVAASGGSDMGVAPSDATVPSDTGDALATGDSSRTDGRDEDRADAVDDVVGDAAGDAIGDGGGDAPFVECTWAAGGGDMLCVLGKSFSLGASNGTACDAGCSAEGPKTTVTVSKFSIDRDEVTVGRFRAYWNTSPRYFPDRGDSVFTGGTKLSWSKTFPSSPAEPKRDTGCTWLGGGIGSNDDKPLNCIDWATALAFCMSDGGKRLPTEAEWELVASAGENRLFPWSLPSTEDGSFSSTDVTCAHSTAKNECGSVLTVSPAATVLGLSKHGGRNFAGSLAEWTLDAYSPDGYGAGMAETDPFNDALSASTHERTIRGGAYLSPVRDLRAAARAGAADSASDPQIGFRCAKRALP